MGRTWKFLRNHGLNGDHLYASPPPTPTTLFLLCSGCLAKEIWQSHCSALINAASGSQVLTTLYLVFICTTLYIGYALEQALSVMNIFDLLCYERENYNRGESYQFFHNGLIASKNQQALHQ